MRNLLKVLVLAGVPAVLSGCVVTPGYGYYHHHGYYHHDHHGGTIYVNPVPHPSPPIPHHHPPRPPRPWRP